MPGMSRKQLSLPALLFAVATGCGGEVTAEGVYTLRATIREPEGLDIDDRRVHALSNDAIAEVVDLKLQNGYAYSLSGLADGDRLCPREGNFETAEDIPIDAPCDEGERIYYLGGNTPGSARRPWQPAGFVFYRSRDGQRFRLLILDHGVEATGDGGRAYVTFELVPGE